MRIEGGGYRRDCLRALAQRVEVDAEELRIMGSKSELLRALVAASSAKTEGFGVPSSVRSGAPDTIRTCDLCLRSSNAAPKVGEKLKKREGSGVYFKVSH
jgi:hypothetical protein